LSYSLALQLVLARRLQSWLQLCQQVLLLARRIAQ
jgi:hypothetical protein